MPGGAVPIEERLVDPQPQDDGSFVMYYTAQKAGGTHCIGTATSLTVDGPYQPQPQPLICDPGGGGAIDAAGYDDGTSRWVVWKVDGNHLGGATTCQGRRPSGSVYKPTPIKIQRVTRDGLTLNGEPKIILDNLGAANDGVVEAPALYQAPSGEFILFYSAHCFTSDHYDVEYAWSDTIDGTYRDRGVLLRTADGIGIYGPGGADIAPNSVNMVFHGRLRPGEGDKGKRELFSATLSIDDRDVHPRL